MRRTIRKFACICFVLSHAKVCRYPGFFGYYYLRVRQSIPSVAVFHPIGLSEWLLVVIHYIASGQYWQQLLILLRGEGLRQVTQYSQSITQIQLYNNLTWETYYKHRYKSAVQDCHLHSVKKYLNCRPTQPTPQVHQGLPAKRLQTNVLVP